MQEQLGLKLQAVTAPVEVLVIDHVEKATEKLITADLKVRTTSTQKG